MTDVFILGGARTPMTEYVGALKDVSAIELGAIAARARDGAHRGQARVDRPRRSSATCCRRAATRIYGARHVALKAGVPIEVPALTVNRLCGSGIQAAVSGAQLIQLGEADIVLDRRHGEHEPGAARHPRPAHRPAAGPGQARGLRCGRRCSIRTAAARWRRPRRTARRSTASRARRRTPTRCAASSSPTRRGATGRFADEVVPVEIKSRKGVDVRRQRRSPAARHDARGAGEAAGGVLEGRHASPPATPAASSTAARRWCSRRRRRCSDARPDAARRGSSRWAAVGVEPTLMGMGPAPAIAQGCSSAPA